jgi:Lon protease-like protein
MAFSEQHTEIIPIFPLNIVLFPQSSLPLHIFEERYKTLISECISYDNEFGINLIHEQNIRSIGCTAVVKEVIKRYDDGQMDIVVEGRRRYSLVNLVEAPHPYYSGRISWYNDVGEDVDDALRLNAVKLYNVFVSTVFTDSVKRVQDHDPRQTRSFFLVQKSGLELMQRQLFLGINSENKRLEMLIRHYEAVLPLLSSQKNIEELAKNDGYIQQ